MPSSHFFQLNEIMELICLSDPKSLLDIGVGFGKFGFLAREYLELWDGWKNYHARKRRIDGIEIFKDYLTPVHDFIYDHVYVGNALELVPNLEIKYDLIILIDVLEHFVYKEAIELLNICRQKSKNILISVPKNCLGQGAVFGNPFEEHKTQFKEEDFRQFGEVYILDNQYSIICYLGENAVFLLHDRKDVLYALGKRRNSPKVL
jgi:hypothetical protein